MQKQLRIVLASVYHISEYYGGNEHYFHNLALGLHEAGHEVTYLTAFAKSGVKTPYNLQIVPVGTVMGKPLPSWEWIHNTIGIKPDVFHASGSGLPIMLTAGVLKHNYATPTVLTFQAPLNPDNKLMQLAGMGETFVSGRAFDAVITTGPYNQNMVQSWWPWVTVKMIPMMLAKHFADDIKLRPKDARKKLKLSEDRPTVLFAGKLDKHHYYKGVDYLLKAATQLPKEYQIVIIGDGDMRKQYETQAKELGVDTQVTFAGFVNDETIRDYMIGSDVFVLPSTSSSEGFGLVLIEAMACNTPVVTTNVIGSASWLKKEKVATLIPPSDGRALAKAIMKQAEHRDNKQVARAKKFAKSFTRKRMVDDTVKLYLELMFNKK